MEETMYVCVRETLLVGDPTDIPMTYITPHKLKAKELQDKWRYKIYKTKLTPMNFNDDDQ